MTTPSRDLDIRDLDGCIRHWKSVLFHSRYLIDPSTDTLINQTVKFLEELKATSYQNNSPEKG